MRKAQIVFTGIPLSIGILMLFIIAYSILSKKQSVLSSQKNMPIITIAAEPSFPKTRIIPQISTTHVIYHPISMNAVPKLPPEKGGGVDENSLIVKNSHHELEKIYPELPFTQNTFINGKQVSIVIAGKNQQDTSWTLYVQIFGVDYTLQKHSPDYQNNKEIFVQAAQLALNWLEKKVQNHQKLSFNGEIKSL